LASFVTPDVSSCLDTLLPYTAAILNDVPVKTSLIVYQTLLDIVSVTSELHGCRTLVGAFRRLIFDAHALAVDTVPIEKALVDTMIPTIVTRVVGATAAHDKRQNNDSNNQVNEMSIHDGASIDSSGLYYT
jgi:hypothetical protein